MSSSLLSISWFGSSGGGLPRRPGLKSLGRFFIAFPQQPTSLYFEHAAQYPPISNRDTTIRNRQSFSTCPFIFSKMSPLGQVQQASPGTLFWILTNGVVRRGMPVWSKLPEPQRWQIVSYLKPLTPAGNSPQ